MSHVSYILVACMAGIAGIAFVHQTVIAKQLDEQGLYPRPQRVSELYFTNPSQLPEAVRVSAMQKVAFTVHNIEHQTTTYTYKLSAVSANNGAAQALGDGVLRLDHDQSQTINETVQVPSIGKRVAIKVELEYEVTDDDSVLPSVQKQSIQYWTKVVGL